MSENLQKTCTITILGSISGTDNLLANKFYSASLTKGLLACNALEKIGPGEAFHVCSLKHTERSML
jgi:hypothetical protein